VAVAATLATISVAGVPPAGAATADSDVVGRGSAPALGAPDGINKPLITMAATADGTGYWLVAADGGVFSYGGAPFYGSTGGMPLNSPVVDMTPTPTGRGYWMVASDGGVFAFGDAGFFGSMGGQPLNQPIVSIAATRSGRGYWMVARDGGVFAFGDARFYGALPGSGSGAAVVDLLVRPQGDGYLMVDEQGGVYGFGSVPFFGALPNVTTTLNGRVVGGAMSSTGNGYWLAVSDGSVYAFGDALFHGAGANAPGQKTIAMATKPDGSGYWLATTTGLAPASLGERGDHVTAIQNRLNEMGYWNADPAGRYSTLTSQAVMAFQKVHGLRRTGQADQQTVDVMSGAAAPRPRTTSGDVVEIDKARQVMFVVRGGRAVYTFNVSTGSQVPYTERTDDGRLVSGDAVTPDGRFSIQYGRPDGWRISDLGRLWRPRYFVGGIAVHGSLSVPSYPASHGCVRVTTPAMDFIWAADLLPRGMGIWVYS
jgi:peptidoglycan hydrolase-like protein with peptidoglycan-binding domain